MQWQFGSRVRSAHCSAPRSVACSVVAGAHLLFNEKELKQSWVVKLAYPVGVICGIRAEAPSASVACPNITTFDGLSIGRQKYTHIKEHRQDKTKISCVIVRIIVSTL